MEFNPKAYDVICAASNAQASAVNRRLALESEGGVFGVCAQSFNKWICDLWELYGDGRTMATALELQLLAVKTLRDAKLDNLPKTPGLSTALVEAMNLGVPIESPEGDITPGEADFLQLVANFIDAVEDKGLTTVSLAAKQLAAIHEEVFPKPLEVLWLDGNEPRYFEQQFFDSVDNLHLTQLSPAYDQPISVPEALTVMGGFAAGPGALAATVETIVRDLFGHKGKLFGEVHKRREGAEEADVKLLIISADPEKLFDSLGPALQKYGISCALQTTQGFYAMTGGKVKLAEHVLQDSSAPMDARFAAFGDLLHGTFQKKSKGRLWKEDAALRGDRLTDPQNLYEGNSVALKQSSILGNSDSSEEAQALRVAEAMYKNAAKAAESLGITEAAVVLEALESLGLASNRSVAFDEQLGVSPRVVITTIHRAAGFLPGSFTAVAALDLSTERYPLKAKTSAVETLLERLWGSHKESSLKKARRQFAYLMSVATDFLILGHPLNDSEGNPCYPCAMLEELVHSFVGRTGRNFPDGKEEKLYGLPKEWLELRFEYGEDKLVETARPGFSLKHLQPKEVDNPTRGLGDSAPEQLFEVAEDESGAKFPRLSPSQIETYMACPYRWFVQSRLGANALDEDMSPASQGIFLHEVFKEFYEAFKSKLTPSNLEEAKAFVFAEGGLFDAVVQRQYAQGANQDGPTNRLVARPNTTEHFIFDSLRKQVESWMNFETQFLAQFTPMAFEVQGTGLEYGGAILKGIVDRVDVDSVGNAVIIDYKGNLKSSHTPRNKKGWVENFKVQTLIYGQLLKRGQLDVGIPVANVCGAFYVSYKPGNAVRGAFESTSISIDDIPNLVSKAASALSPTGEETFESLLDRAEEHVTEAVSRLVDGDISPNPRDKEDCQYCPVLLCERRKS